MKITSKHIMLITVLGIGAVSSGCSLLSSLIPGMMLAGDQNSGLFVSPQDSAQGNTPYRVTTNPANHDGKAIYGYYEESSGH